MIRRPPRATRTDTLFPYTTLFRSACTWIGPKASVDWACSGATPMSTGIWLAAEKIVVTRRWANASRSTSSIPAKLRSEEHTSELQSLIRISYAVICLKKKKNTIDHVETTEPNTTIDNQTQLN